MVVRFFRSHPLPVLAILNILFYAWCLRFVVLTPSDDYSVKQSAASMAVKAQQVIGAGLIGEEYTAITTTLGALDAKRLSMNADFAAVAADLLRKAGIEAGDTVAVSMSGSFPALNIAVLSAISAVGAQPVIVSSVGASTWGANRPGYTWLDMEKNLAEAGVWAWRSTGASVGGVGDRGGGLSPEGIELTRQAIERSGVRAIDPPDLAQAVALRLAIFKEKTGELPGALVNVGGGHFVFGRQGHGIPLRPGLLFGYRTSMVASDGLIAEFINGNRPVIHFLNIKRLAAKYDIEAEGTPGTSSVYYVRGVPVLMRGLIVGWLSANLILLWFGRTRQWWTGPCN